MYYKYWPPIDEIVTLSQRWLMPQTKQHMASQTHFQVYLFCSANGTQGEAPNCLQYVY